MRQVGEPARDGASELGASTMDMLVAEGKRVFCPDFRGLGGTKRDEGGWTTPNRCNYRIAPPGTDAVLRRASLRGVHAGHCVRARVSGQGSSSLPIVLRIRDAICSTDMRDHAPRRRV
eukprot:853922-Rhodomonas_salina.2